MMSAAASQKGRRLGRRITDSRPVDAVLGILRRRCRDEQGAVVVLVAILLPVLLGMAGLVIDVGSWYLTQAQLQTAADAAALAGAQDLPSSPSSAQTAAQSYASANVSGATVTSVTPYNGSSDEIQVTLSERGSIWFAPIFGISAPTITASAVAESTPGTGSVTYAASTACNAITINASDGAFNTTLWSNGGFVNNGSDETVSHVDVGNTSCSFPASLTPPGPTDVGNYTGWPAPLPTVAQGNFPSSCSSTSINIVGSSWLTSNPPGIYCTTGTISITTSSVTFNGYEFISESTSSSAIDVNGSSTAFYGYCPGDPGDPSSCPAGGTPQTIFYATAGGIQINSSAGTFTGSIFAPDSSVSINMSGTNTGFIEAYTITINGSSFTVTGTGPTPFGGVSLIG